LFTAEIPPREPSSFAALDRLPCTAAKTGAATSASAWPPKRVSPAQVARIIDESEASLLDVLDNLLNRGVVLNADLILALANVDLVYVRLSALLCAADRLLPRDPK
jgi:hypothetical protein